MHELGITQSVVDICAERAGSARVSRVTLEIGCLSGIVADSLLFCYPLCAEGTSLEGSSLDIVAIPARACCRDCGSAATISDFLAPCRCGSQNLDISGGDDLRIKSMELC